MSEQFITIPKWNTFQHYKDGRAPTWIKTYLELLSDDTYLDLAAGDRAVLHGVWILAATDKRNAEKEVATISVRRCRTSLGLRSQVVSQSLERLNQAGWIGLGLDASYRTRTNLVPNPGTSRAPAPSQEQNRTEEFFLEGQSEDVEGGSATTNGQPPPENPDHENQTKRTDPDNPYGATGLPVHPDDFSPPDPTAALTPSRPHLTKLNGELGDAVDHLLSICHDRDDATPKVIDRLAAPLNPAEVNDTIEAISVNSPASPTRYAVRILQSHQVAT